MQTPPRLRWLGTIPPLRALILLALLALSLLWAEAALAHAVTLGDKGYIQEITGPQIIPFLYLGAKHMITGYDHILFLFGVIFFLYGMKEIGLYVTLFAIGHSATMIIGVWFNFGINAYIIDAIIGFSVVYKALDNLGAFKTWFGVQPDTRTATLVFGLLHGFGLASKIIEYNISPDGQRSGVRLRSRSHGRATRTWGFGRKIGRGGLGNGVRKMCRSSTRSATPSAICTDRTKPLCPR